MAAQPSRPAAQPPPPAAPAARLKPAKEHLALPEPADVARALVPLVLQQQGMPEFLAYKQKVVAFQEMSLVWWSLSPQDLEENYHVMFVLLHSIPHCVPNLHYLGTVMLHLHHQVLEKDGDALSCVRRDWFACIRRVCFKGLHDQEVKLYLRLSRRR